MKRSVPVLYILAVLFAVIAVADLVARPYHYERTLVLAVVLAAVLGIAGAARRRGGTG
jgi:hypothetical protein